MGGHVISVGQDRWGMWDMTGRACGTQRTGCVGCDGQGMTVGHMGHDGQSAWESGHDREGVWDTKPWLYVSVVPGIQRPMSTMLNGPCMHHAWTMGGIKAPTTHVDLLGHPPIVVNK